MALYAIIYTAFILSFLNTVNANIMMTIAVNALGAYFLITVFWNRYVGRTTLYQKKFKKKPLIISVIIVVFMVALEIYDTEFPD